MKKNPEHVWHIQVREPVNLFVEPLFCPDWLSPPRNQVCLPFPCLLIRQSLSLSSCPLCPTPPAETQPPSSSLVCPPLHTYPDSRHSVHLHKRFTPVPRAHRRIFCSRHGSFFPIYREESRFNRTYFLPFSPSFSDRHWHAAWRHFLQ